MIKVLYLMNHAGKAGTERYVQSLVEKLKGDKIEPYFAYNEEGLLVERMKDLGVQTFQITMKNPFDLLAARKLARLCKKLDIDIVHAQYLRENYIALFSRLFNKKTKVMYTNHFILVNNAVLRVWNRILSPLQESIIAVCNNGKKMMIRNGVDGSKIKVVFNGVDPEFWGEPVKSTMREEFGIGEDEFVMFCGSRFAYDKGHEFLINAIAELKKITNTKFRLVLANDGPLLEQRKQQVKDLGLEKDIIFIGFRKDMKNLISGSDLYINSSQHEALSFAIIEVLAAGLPVVATDMGGNGDIINDETKCGMLVQYNDSKGLANTMKEIMDNPRLQAELRQNALKAIRERFSIDNMVTQAYNLYIKAVEGK